MRWLVEVAALGKGDKESLFVEAESWQKALQAARAQRGDTAPMSGFSIELLDDGCRAVDPMSRLRYEVRKARDEDASGGARSQPPRASAAVSQPAQPAVRSQPAAPAAPAHAPAPSQSAAAAAPQAAPAAAPASRRAAPAASPARTIIGGPSPGLSGGAQPHEAPPAPQPPAAVHAPAPVAPVAQPRTDVAAPVVPSQVIFKREQDPTDAMPLAYREYVFLVPPGTTEVLAETLLATQFELVRGSLERLPPGKLVNLGVFDIAFQGKPPVPPLATLAWKDWRGAPVVAFPRRAAPAVAAPAPAPYAAPQAPVAPVIVPQYAPAPVAPAQVAPVAPHVAPAPLMAPAFPAPAMMPAPVVPAPVFAAPYAQPTPSPADAVTPFAAPFQAPFQVPAAPARAPSAGSIRVPGTRIRGEDLIADLFESMHDLHFLRDAIEGGEFCLSLAMEKLPSQAGIVHLYDIDKREFLVTSTRGAGTSGLLMRRHPENEPLLLAAMNRRRAIVIADATVAPAAAVDRYTAVGGARSLIIAPVMQHGRFLGAIEIMNPLDGAPFTEAEGNALNYIAEQFAEFLASHGIVTDPERISARQLPEA